MGILSKRLVHVRPRGLLGCALTCAVLIAAAMVPWRPAVRAEPDGLVLIVSTETPLQGIDSATVRRAFEGHPVEYATGKRLIPFNAPWGTPERELFDRIVLGMGPDDVGRFWVDQRIRGASPPPRTLASPGLAVRVISALPGAITYVLPSQLTANVRALAIDGKSPDHPDYLLAGD